MTSSVAGRRGHGMADKADSGVCCRGVAYHDNHGSGSNPTRISASTDDQLRDWCRPDIRAKPN
jgi:hypothetical protein